MARPKTISVTGVGTSAAIPVDWRKEYFALSILCNVSGSATYSVQHTLDNVLAGATPVWVDHPTLVGKTGTADGNYAFPVTAVRLNVTAGTGTVNMRLVQAGIE